jgi:hypothetical protein
MSQVINAFVALGVMATWMSLSTASATSAETCVVANFKNAKNACPAGIKLEAQQVVTPTSAPADAGCVKSNVKNFKNRCPG